MDNFVESMHPDIMASKLNFKVMDNFVQSNHHDKAGTRWRYAPKGTNKLNLEVS